jgi:hypothetical protein
MRTVSVAKASATPLPALMARTCALLGPDLAIRAGIDPRLQRITAEWQWLTAVLIVGSTMAVWIGGDLGANLAAMIWSIAVARGIHHWYLLRKVAPAQVLATDEFADWQSAMHALPDRPSAEIIAAPLDELRRRPVARAIDVARTCAFIALAEESRLRRIRTPAAHRPPDHASDAR